MKPIDRLYTWSLILSLGATFLMFIGVLLPNWWLQKDTKGTTTRIFGLFGSIHCGPSVCYPDDQLPVSPATHATEAILSTSTTDLTTVTGSTPDPGTTSVNESTVVADVTTTTDATGTTAADESTNVTESQNASTSTSTSKEDTVSDGPVSPASPHVPGTTAAEHPPNAGWLVAGRVFSGIGLFLVTVTLLLQIAYHLFPRRLLQIVSLGFLVAAALDSFITGFIFINKFSALTSVYVTERPPGALTYTPAAAGCILISSLLCVVSGVFTLMASYSPAGSSPSSTKKASQKKTTLSDPSTLPTSQGEGDEAQLLA